MARLELSFLGPFQVRLEGRPVTSFEADKVRALLVYLAVEASRPHRREQLASLFWPGWPDASARTSLRNALSNLRSAIRDDSADPPFLLITRETIQFNPASDHRLDQAELERMSTGSADADQLQSALALYRGSFLEGFTLKDCPAFDDWSYVVKDGLQTKVSTVFNQLATIFGRIGNTKKPLDVPADGLPSSPGRKTPTANSCACWPSAVSARLPWRSSRPASVR